MYIKEYVVKTIFLLFGLIIISSCIKDFSFEEVPEERALIVEGFVSDVSYNDFSALEASPRYFEVDISWSSEVSNVKDEVVTNAEVTIANDLNENWDYIEVEDGVYRLEYEDFKIEEGRSYKLQIKLDDGRFYESSMDQANFVSTTGDISLVENEEYSYEYPNGEETITLKRGVDLYLDLKVNEPNEHLDLKWDFEVTYVFFAYEIDETIRVNNPYFQCWINNRLYFDDVVTSAIGIEPVSQKMIFVNLDVLDIHDGFSVLIRQQTGTSGYHEYWEGINQQKAQSDLFAPPPYNLNSNLRGVGHDGAVYGYFGVVSEQYYRWYFDKNMVSYDLPHPPEEDFCPPPFMGLLPAIPACYNCLDYAVYNGSSVTNVKPSWWND